MEIIGGIVWMMGVIVGGIVFLAMLYFVSILIDYLFNNK